MILVPTVGTSIICGKHAVEMSRESIALIAIQRQFGRIQHADLTMT